MKQTSIGIINYGFGNHSSLQYSLKKLNYDIVSSADTEILEDKDVIILPGVGAFKKTMEFLERSRLSEFLIKRSNKNKPIIGICLGMQILTESSNEIEFTKGLQILPGKFENRVNIPSHIGWNRFTSKVNEPIFTEFDNEYFYFNHCFFYNGDSKYVVCETNSNEKFASIIRKDKIIGLQFHPEKSQIQGMNLLKKIIDSIADD